MPEVATQAASTHGSPAVLSGSEIRNHGIVTHGVSGSYRPTSYDATVGIIITRKRQSIDSTKEFHVLKPQGVVEVISVEHFKVPDGITGFASVRTRLCDEGIMALNIGIIDPGYEGRVSTTLVNFGKDDFVVRRGEPFLRLTFLHCTLETDDAAKKTVAKFTEDEGYIAKKAEKAVRFSDTFLNLRSAIAAEARPVFWQFAAIGGALIALFAFSVNLGLVTVARTYWSRAEVRQDVLQDIRQDRLEDIRKQLVAMRAERDALADDQKKLRDDLEKIRSQIKTASPNKSPKP